MGEEREGKEMKKGRSAGNYVLAAVIVLLTGVNAFFGAVNFQAINDGKRAAETETESLPETETESESTEPESTEPEATYETFPVPESYYTGEEETETEPETEPETLSLLEQEPRYSECLIKYKHPGILLGESSYTNIRKEPSLDSTCVGKAMRYSVFEVLEETGDWYLVESEGHQGYIYKDLVTTGSEAVTYAMEHCKLYAYAPKVETSVYRTPKTSRKNKNLLHYMFMDKKYPVLDTMGDWIKVYINPDYDGYSRTEDVILVYEAEMPVFYNEDGTVSKLREDIINYAFQWFGGEYVWGGTSLGGGVDCSGYVLEVYDHFGIPLPRLSAEQAAWGEGVASIEEALPGDLLFYPGTHDGVTSAGVGHVGIYIGNRKMIHAASETRGIVCDDFDYLEAPMAIRRVIQD